MAPPKKDPFKVIIVGGGVVGLTLANMLDKFDIDYVLLESHGDIAPPVGASIAVMPNGHVIMDQLGCYDDILAASEAEGKELSTSSRALDGSIIQRMDHFRGHLQARFGYPLLFFDRQYLLQILYSHITHKDRVFLNKRVDKVTPTATGISVSCRDGTSLMGHVVIGGDGIHSSVRREMFRIGQQSQQSPDSSSFSDAEEDAVPCHYQCSFGIAEHVPDWDTSCDALTTGKGYSWLVANGPGGKLYWFLFVRLPDGTKYGKDIPRYSAADEEAFVALHGDKKITEKLTFRQVYERRISSTLTPLHEVVYKKWFHGRIMLMGDSAHKPNPIGGQGGNSAMETAAEWVNSLLRLRDRLPNQDLGLATVEDLEGVAERTQRIRHPRVTFQVRSSHEQQAVFAYENKLLSSLVWNVLAPLGDAEGPLDSMGERFLDASRLERLPVPKRGGRVVPYTVELPAKPLSTRAEKIGKYVFASFAAALLFGVAPRALRLVDPKFLDTWAGSASLAPLGDRTWVPGSKTVNEVLRMLVSVFSYPVTGTPDPAMKVQLVYFLSQVMAPILIYTVEGHRTGNRGTLLSLPSVFNGLMQVLTIGKVAPLHALLGAFSMSESPATRHLKPEVARSLLPAVVMGYVVPSVLMLIPGKNVAGWQDRVALWQIAPPLVSLLVSGMSWWWRRRRQQQSKMKKDEKMGSGSASADDGNEKLIQNRYANARDLPHLQRTYFYLAGLQAAAHVATMGYVFLSPASSSLTLSNIFFNLPNPFRAEDWPTATTASNVASQLSVFFKYDMLLGATAAVSQSLYSVWNLRRRGYVTTKKALQAAAGVLLGQVLVGHGATWTALWGWREGVIAGLSTFGREEPEKAEKMESNGKPA